MKRLFIYIYAIDKFEWFPRERGNGYTKQLF